MIADSGVKSQAVKSIELSYFVCATPRSGSSFLCEVLRTTGVAGVPDDYFWNPPFWFERWGVSDSPKFAERLLREGSTANGVFGSKLMWDQLHDAATQFAALLGWGGAGPSDVLAAAFPNVHYVWLTRRDKFLFPTAHAALRYYASGAIDALQDCPSDGSHRRGCSAWLAHIEEIIRSEGVFRDAKDAGCFVATAG